MSYYLIYVVGLTENVSALCILSGQIADGITTPVVGVLSDKWDCAMGKRTCWYVMGSLLVIPSFSFIFTSPAFLTVGPTQNAWYITWPAIFNVGWASVQISNMSIVNQLTYSQRKRDQMINLRQGFTFAANIFILTASLTLFILI